MKPSVAQSKDKTRQSVAPIQNPWRRQRTKRQRLVVPPSDDEDDSTQDLDHDVYEFDPFDFFCNLTTRHTYRPLPAISTLLAGAPQQQQQQLSIAEDDDVIQVVSGKNMSSKPNEIQQIPLLTEFFDSLKKRDSQNQCVNGEISSEKILEEAATPTKKNSSVLDEFSATLAKGHHTRFKELLVVLEKEGVDLSHHKKKFFPRHPQQEKEFRKLCELFREERRLYSLGIEQFLQENINRFLIGFKGPHLATAFVNTSSRHTKLFKEKWENATSKPATKYGKCCQAISLHMASNKLRTKLRVDTETFSPKIVYIDVETTGRLRRMNCHNLLEPGFERKQLSPPKVEFTTANVSPLLCEDSMARDLAIQLKVDFVITAKALSALLLIPGKGLARWMLPFSFKKFKVSENLSNKQNLEVTFVEDPVPHATTPRERLTEGFTEAIYYHTMVRDPKHSHTCPASANVFTLLTIPQSVTQDSFKVLVRSSNILHDQTGNPTKLHSHLEYFIERGMEQYSSQNQAVWLLEKILQPSANIVVCRVDPTSACLIQVEEKSLAYLLANGDNIMDSQSRLFGPLQDVCELHMHFQAMIDVMQGIRTVKQRWGGRYVVCLPGRGVNASSTTATVHKAVNDETDEATAEVSINQEICESDAVYLANSALRECFQLWQWTDSRMSFTFPLDCGENH